MLLGLTFHVLTSFTLPQFDSETRPSSVDLRSHHSKYVNQLICCRIPCALDAASKTTASA